MISMALLPLYALFIVLISGRAQGAALQPTNSGKNGGASETCMDNPPGAPKTNCALIVRANNCGHQYYGPWCCKSCSLANQMKATKGDSSTNGNQKDDNLELTTERMSNDQPYPDPTTEGMSNDQPNAEPVATKEPVLGPGSAEKACKTFGKDWKITRKTLGSSVCSTVPSDENCHSCDSWRLLVWKDGACDRLVSSQCRSNVTESGSYYCGYDPCQGGDLVHGGVWGPFGAHPNE